MTDIKWGKPLSGEVMKRLGLPKNTLCKFDGNAKTVSFWSLDCDDACYRLPADHPANIVAAHNAKHGTDFVYWAGGDAAPEGWQDALFRDGETLSATRQYGRSASTWVHIGSATDIIGYTRKTEEPAQPATPTLDLSKPVQTRDGRPVRILCISTWAEDGSFTVGLLDNADLINVPERVVRWWGVTGEGLSAAITDRSKLWEGYEHHLRITWTDGIPEARVFAADEEEG